MKINYIRLKGNQQIDLNVDDIKSIQEYFLFHPQAKQVMLYRERLIFLGQGDVICFEEAAYDSTQLVSFFFEQLQKEMEEDHLTDIEKTTILNWYKQLNIVVYDAII